MDRISVGNQEKCGGKTVLVEDRNGLFELTSQSVIEGEGNKCWFVHCLATIVFHLASLRSLTQVSSFGVSVGAVSQDKGVQGKRLTFLHGA
jgi:hypothetical protein